MTCVCACACVCVCVCMEPCHIHIHGTSAAGSFASSMTVPSSALDMRPTTSLLAWALSKGRSTAAVGAATSAPGQTAFDALVAPPASPLRARRECAMGSLLRAASPAPAQGFRLRAGGRGDAGNSAGACGSGTSCDNVRDVLESNDISRSDDQTVFTGSSRTPRDIYTWVTFTISPSRSRCP